MIAREGLALILTVLTVSAVTALAAARWDSLLLAGLAGMFSLFTVFTTYFFRDPERSCDIQPHILVSPADGRILAVENLALHEQAGDKAIKISIFMSVWDVHVNRLPADGVVDYVHYHPGEFGVAYRDKASLANERTEIGITTTGGHKLELKQIAGILARRIVCHLKAGDLSRAGERFGMIRFGSRAELIVPCGSRILVEPGQQVKAGQTILGFLPTQEKNVQL